MSRFTSWVIGLGYFLASYSLMADGSTHWDSFFYISIPNSNGTGNFVPSYNYTDETGLKFLLEGNVSISIQYSTGHGRKVFNTVWVPEEVFVNQTYNSSSGMVINFEWGLDDGYNLQFNLSAEPGLWSLTEISFCFVSGCPIANISGNRCCLSTGGELVTAVREHGFKCSSLIISGLKLDKTSGSAIADIEITPIEVQAFDFTADNFSPNPLVCPMDRAVGQIPPIIIGSIIGLLFITVLVAYITFKVFKKVKRIRSKHPQYDIIQ